MSVYAEYQEINLPWLKAIPAHWEVRRNKNIFTEQKEIVGEKSSDYTLLSLTLNGIVPRDMEGGGKFPESFDKYKVVRSGDMAFCLFDVDETPRTVGLSGYDGMLTGAYTIMHVSNINSRFIYYYYLALDNGKMLKPLYSGLRKTININTFQSVKVPVPPREEQDQIVRFLDWKVASINRLINIKKAEIKRLEELKLTRLFAIVTQGLNEKVELIDSGIEHIGLVPSHWKVLLNHRIYKENCRSFSGDETVLSLSQKDGLLPYVEMKERSLHTASYENWKLVLPNDLVLNRFKAHLGVFFSSNYRGIVTFHYGVYEPIMKVSSKYYEVLFHTPKYKQVFAGASNGMTVGLQNLSNTNFYKVYTVYPPYEEQCAIVAEVQKIENEMQAIISTISKEIGILHEFKTRLISDVVTGKIDVRSIEIPEYEFVEETGDTENDESMEGMEGETYEE